MTSIGAALAAKVTPKPMRKLHEQSDACPPRHSQYVPGSDEHVEVPGTGLETDGGQHNRRADPDGDLTAKAIGEIWSEWVSSQGADVLTGPE